MIGGVRLIALERQGTLDVKKCHEPYTLSIHTFTLRLT